MPERRTAIIIASIAVVVGILLVWAFLPSAQDQVSAAPVTEISLWSLS